LFQTFESSHIVTPLRSDSYECAPADFLLNVKQKIRYHAEFNFFIFSKNYAQTKPDNAAFIHEKHEIVENKSVRNEASLANREGGVFKQISIEVLLVFFVYFVDNSLSWVDGRSGFMGYNHGYDHNQSYSRHIKVFLFNFSLLMHTFEK
jgi:hypothetical protein